MILTALSSDTSWETLFTASAEDQVTVQTLLISLCAALLLGFVIAVTYWWTHRKEGYNPGFVVTLILLPVVISAVILFIGSNVARAFSLAGAFSLVRYRSAPGNPKDIAFVFFAMATGLACGMGFVLSASVFAIFVCLVLVVLHLFRFAESREESMQLSVSVPENICFQGLFDDLLDRYCEGYRQKRVKTSDFGTVFEIVFHIRLKKSTNQKEFLDELRQRNGNLPISLVLKENENHFACAEM